MGVITEEIVPYADTVEYGREFLGKSQIVLYNADTYDDMVFFLTIYQKLVDKSGEEFDAAFDATLNSFLDENIPFYEVLSGLYETFSEQNFIDAIVDIYYDVMNHPYSSLPQEDRDELLEQSCSVLEDVSVEYGETLVKACKIVLREIIGAGETILSDIEFRQRLDDFNFEALFASIGSTFTTDYFSDLVIDTAKSIGVDIAMENPAVSIATKYVKTLYYLVELYNNYQWAAHCEQVSDSLDLLMDFIIQSKNAKLNLRLDYYVLSTPLLFADDMAYTPVADQVSLFERYFFHGGIERIACTNTTDTSYPTYLSGNGLTISGTVSELTYTEFYNGYVSLIQERPNTNFIECVPTSVPNYYYNFVAQPSF